jgi:hypothetical protein
MRRWLLGLAVAGLLSLSIVSVAMALSGRSKGYELSFARGSVTLDLPGPAGSSQSLVIACGPRGSERTLTVLVPATPAERTLRASSPRPAGIRRCVVYRAQKRLVTIDLR